MKLKTRFRIASLLARGIFVLFIGLAVMQIAKADRTSPVRPKLPTGGEIPNSDTGWEPNWNITGKWVQTRLLVSDAGVVLNCDDDAYACASIERVFDHPLIGGRCTIYMPEYSGYPKARPPKNWYWLLGKEKAHCDFGYYH